ncbi:hypothetical protein V6N12_037388 [Hibiscus sabdariffa]|uniref:Uncharacterized protein n=1 Tax=Hibiscus sabdariffa TaxID=183260 RepID=A0ABR2BZ36_9ROSI
MMIWELCLRFVQRQIALLPDAPNGVVSIVQATTVTKDIPHDPMFHTDTSDVVEEAVEDASLDPENSETAADRLASEDVPYDPMSWAFPVCPGLSSPYSYAGGA